jgi:transcriptional regulator with XRE-family HTH domain
MENIMSTTSRATKDNFSENVATFGERLAAARETKGLSVDGLAEKIGVETSKVQLWESNDDAPRANRIQMLAGMLNVSIIWLISGESNGTSHVADTFERPTGINDALGEISQLKVTLSGALEKLEQLEQRLQEG